MEEPDFPEWIDDVPAMDEEACVQAAMRIDSDTRACQVVLEGRAGWILQFLQSEMGEGMIKQLEQEATFDQITKGFFDSPDDGQVDRCD